MTTRDDYRGTLRRAWDRAAAPEPIDTPDPGRPINVGSGGRARGDRPAELDPAMVEAAARAVADTEVMEHPDLKVPVFLSCEQAEMVAITALTAAGVPGLVAEVERWKRAWQEGDRAWAEDRARATSAEQERDRLRAWIEGLAGDPTAQDETGTWIDRKRVADLLAGSGEQPGEVDGYCTCHDDQKGRTRDCGVKDHREGGRPISAVPDSRDVRERVRRAVRRAATWTEDGPEYEEAPDAGMVEKITDAVLAAVGQSVTAEPLKVEWGVVLDDARSTDVYESREQAEAMAVYADGVCEVVRIETWPHTPAVVRSGEQDEGGE